MSCVLHGGIAAGLREGVAAGWRVSARYLDLSWGIVGGRVEGRGGMMVLVVTQLSANLPSAIRKQNQSVEQMRPRRCKK